MAIDQEIQQKVDAYRGNPQALQQRYAQNQQLVDLLALQKLKSEMDAAKRDVQMKMQQQPSTIKQQREQELMQRTKQEMMDQTAGVMRQKQAQQQQNLKKVAQGGLGALAPQRPPAPNPAQQVANQSQPVPKMAAGGIVAFQEGGLSSMAGLGGDMSLEEQIAMIRRRTDLDEGQKQSLINQVRAQQPREEARRQFTTPVGRASSARMPGVQGNIPVGSETSALDVLSETRPQIAPTRTEVPMGADLAGLGMGPAQRLGPRGASAGIESLVPTAGPDDGLRGGPADATTPTTEAPVAEAPADGGVASLPRREAGIGSGGAEAAMERGFARADAYTGRQEKADRFAEMEARLAEFDQSTYDPAEERRDQLKAFLIGTAGRGSTALAGGAAASMNLRRNQRDERRQRLMDQFELAKTGMALDTDLAQLGMTLGREMYAQVSQNARTAAQIAASRDQAELRASLDRAQLDYDRLKDDRQFALDERAAVLAERQQEFAESKNDVETVNRIVNDIRETQIAVYNNLRENSPLPDLEMQLAIAEGDQAEQIQTQIDAIEEDLVLRTEEVLNQMRVLDLRDDALARQAELTGLRSDRPITSDDVTGIRRPGQ